MQLDIPELCLVMLKSVAPIDASSAMASPAPVVALAAESALWSEAK